MKRFLRVFFCVCLVLPGITVSGPTRMTATPRADEPIVPLPESGGFDYQLGGGYEPANGIEIVVRDSTDEPEPGLYSICYVNGFQTQPGTSETWFAVHPDVLLRDEAGEPIIDPGWPDEYVLDPRTDEQRAAILTVLGPVIDQCAADGFQAVEIDNFDTWTRFEQLDQESSFALVAMYIDRAHAAGLAIGQKNAAEVAELGAKELGFDFAVAESCFVWSECDLYRDAFGLRVLAIEYSDEIEVPAEEVCAAKDRASRTIIRDHDLTTPSDPEYVFVSCPEHITDG